MVPSVSLSPLVKEIWSKVLRTSYQLTSQRFFLFTFQAITLEPFGLETQFVPFWIPQSFSCAMYYLVCL